MEYIFLLLVGISSKIQNTIKKECDKEKERTNSQIFTIFSCSASLLFFLIVSKFKLALDVRIVPYSLFFAIAYICSWFGLYASLKYGSFAITSLIQSYCLVVPVLYGIVFLQEKVTLTIIIGLALFAISLIFLKGKSENSQVSPKWIISSFVMFLGCGFCSASLKIKQHGYGNGSSNEFLILGFAIVIVLLLLYEWIKKERVKGSLKRSLTYGGAFGLVNGLATWLQVFLVMLIPSVILYPSLSACGIIVSFLIAICVYKEKITWRQSVAFGLSVISVVLLNL